MTVDVKRKKYSVDYHGMEVQLDIEGPEKWGPAISQVYSAEVTFKSIPNRTLKYKLEKYCAPTDIIENLMCSEEGIEMLLSNKITEDERREWKTKRRVMKSLLELEKYIKEDFPINQL